jgi:hypothetical protein
MSRKQQISFRLDHCSLPPKSVEVSKLSSAEIRSEGEKWVRRTFIIPIWFRPPLSFSVNGKPLSDDRNHSIPANTEVVISIPNSDHISIITLHFPAPDNTTIRCISFGVPTYRSPVFVPKEPLDRPIPWTKSEFVEAKIGSGNNGHYQITFEWFLCQISKLHVTPKYYCRESCMRHDMPKYFKMALIWSDTSQELCWDRVKKGAVQTMTFDEQKVELVTFIVPTGEKIDAFLSRRSPDICRKWAHDYLTVVCPYTDADYWQTYPNGAFRLEESVGEGGHRVIKIILQREKLGKPGPEHVKIRLEDGSIFAWRWPADTLIEEAEAQLPFLIGPEMSGSRLSCPADPFLRVINQLAAIAEPLFTTKPLKLWGWFMNFYG